MGNINKDSCTYFGLLDDSVSRFPWQFKIDKDYLDYLLSVELIQGKPVLLNDGYLVNNELIRNELMNEKGLLWELINKGFVKVMSRGRNDYGLDEMPVRMAKEIPTFNSIIKNEIPGIEWNDLRSKLHKLDMNLRSKNHLISWPNYDAGSGFLALCKNIHRRGASPHSLGIGRYVGKNTFVSFLNEIIDLLSKDSRAPRTKWENLAKVYANCIDNTNSPEKFVRALMNLANEIYHYNMGILLAADNYLGVSVQTQTSPAFDDLLIPPNMHFLASEIPNLPRLNIPFSITQVDPIRLAELLTPERSVSIAREKWIESLYKWKNSSEQDRLAMNDSLKNAGKEYSQLLTEFVGERVRFKETEELIQYAFGTLSDSLVAGGVALTTASSGVDIQSSLAASVVAGYLFSRARTKYVGNVLSKFRIRLIDKLHTLPPDIAKRSSQVMHTIKRRRTPSTIEITPSVTMNIRPELKQLT